MPSVTVDELRNSVAGGAAALNHGEKGASAKEMLAFWHAQRLSTDLCGRLASRADSEGGVWGDPPTLNSRVHELQRIIPLVPLERLMRKMPEVVTIRPETVHRKLKALSTALPTIDTFRMVLRYPYLLRRSSDFLTSKSATILGLLPRDDMAQVLCEAPWLLDISQEELATRAALLQRLYARASINRWKRFHLLRLLRTPSNKLRQLEHVDRLNPKLRVAVHDSQFLQMAENTFHRRFVARRKSHWKRGPRDDADDPRVRYSTAFDDVPIPTKGYVLEWGASRAGKKKTGQFLPEVKMDRLLP